MEPTPKVDERLKELFDLLEKDRHAFEDKLPIYYLSNYCLPYHLLEIYEYAVQTHSDSLLIAVVRSYLKGDFSHPLLDEAVASYYERTLNKEAAIRILEECYRRHGKDYTLAKIEKLQRMG